MNLTIILHKIKCTKYVRVNCVYALFSISVHVHVSLVSHTISIDTEVCTRTTFNSVYPICTIIFASFFDVLLFITISNHINFNCTVDKLLTPVRLKVLTILIHYNQIQTTFSNYCFFYKT